MVSFYELFHWGNLGHKYLWLQWKVMGKCDHEVPWQWLFFLPMIEISESSALWDTGCMEKVFCRHTFHQHIWFWTCHLQFAANMEDRGGGGVSCLEAHSKTQFWIRTMAFIQTIWWTCSTHAIWNKSFWLSTKLCELGYSCKKYLITTLHCLVFSLPSRFMVEFSSMTCCCVHLARELSVTHSKIEFIFIWVWVTGDSYFSFWRKAWGFKSSGKSV